MRLLPLLAALVLASPGCTQPQPLFDVGGPGTDAPAFDGGARDAPAVDAPGLDTPADDAGAADAPISAMDAPAVDARPLADAPVTGDAPSLDCDAAFGDTAGYRFCRVTSGGCEFVIDDTVKDCASACGGGGGGGPGMGCEAAYTGSLLDPCTSMGAVGCGNNSATLCRCRLLL